MYLKIDCPLELPQLARLLAPDAAADYFDRNSHNVCERLYLTLPNLPFALSIFREHGDSAVLPAAQKGVAKPGSVYILGWDRSAERDVETLPDWLAQHIADELLLTVFIYSGRFNCDVPDPQPIDAVRPHLLA